MTDWVRYQRCPSSWRIIEEISWASTSLFLSAFKLGFWKVFRELWQDGKKCKLTYGVSWCMWTVRLHRRDSESLLFGSQIASASKATPHFSPIKVPCRDGVLLWDFHENPYDSTWLATTTSLGLNYLEETSFRSSPKSQIKRANWLWWKVDTWFLLSLFFSLFLMFYNESRQSTYNIL